MGTSTFSKHDLEMIDISWSFVRNKQELGLNTMIRYKENNSKIKLIKFLRNFYIK